MPTRARLPWRWGWKMPHTLWQLPALRERAIRQYGSVEAYAEHLADQDEAELDCDVQTYMQSYNASRERHLREVYEDGRRDEAGGTPQRRHLNQRRFALTRGLLEST